MKGSPACTAAFEDALFWVGEIGANDYAYAIGSSLTPEAVRDLAVKNVAGFLQVCSLSLSLSLSLSVLLFI